MKTSIQIISGKCGWHLKVNGLFISQSFGKDIKAIKCDCGIPYGATEWVSVQAIREFWHKYMLHIIGCTGRPYLSIWGELKPLVNLYYAGKGRTPYKGSYHSKGWFGFAGFTKELPVMFRLVKSVYPNAIIRLNY